MLVSTFAKFGKHLQKRQLDIPEYAASFVNYKALKKLIKKLSATPILHAQNELNGVEGRNVPQTALQANKATFFFRLERELEKVNAFYLQKEAELRLRLKTLMDKKKRMQTHAHTPSKLSASFMALEEGFQQFGNDLNKLQQFVEVNATAFSKILKKWDKTSKSRTKELYLSRAVDVQPCFNREVISELSDQATTSLLELGAWAEGEKVLLDGGTGSDYVLVGQHTITEEDDIDSRLLEALNSGNIASSQEWITRLSGLPNAKDHITRIFLSAIAEASEDALSILLQTDLVDFQAEDEINERNCLHEAAIFGRLLMLTTGLSKGVDAARPDVYGRIALHYACVHGRIDMVETLIAANPVTIDAIDHDRFTPLIHAIVHGQLDCVQKLLTYPVRFNPSSDSDHIPLNLACQHGHVDIVRLLLEKEAQVLPDAEGLFPQHLVARSGKTPQLLLLLRQFGANLDEIDKLNQWTPLFHAASEGHVDCLRVLLKNGARVDILDEKGLSAKYHAAWEGHLKCVKLLGPVGAVPSITNTTASSQHSQDNLKETMIAAEADGIPDLSLPPPFIPLRRYGHNFLDSKTFVQITLGEGASDAIVFYDGSKYPAARLTVSSKISDLIPRNILLPVQEDNRTISFQIENLDAFTIDFEIFPTFGTKMIAKTVALSDIFSSRNNSSGQCCLPLFDPRLRAIGQIKFCFQVIKPFRGTSLEITDFATYWKATAQIDSPPTAPITDSSLSSEYVRLYVQLTSDSVPVLHAKRCLEHEGIEIPITQLTSPQTYTIAEPRHKVLRPFGPAFTFPARNIADASVLLADSLLEVCDALQRFPSGFNVELHILYPQGLTRPTQGLASSIDLNEFADTILEMLFEHARDMRKNKPDFVQSIIFSSYSPDVCAALTWKQPNYPIFLCNDLGWQMKTEEELIEAMIEERGGNEWRGGDDEGEGEGEGEDMDEDDDDDEGDEQVKSLSIKEAVKIAQNNNFMGLICSSRLLDMAPALVDSIRAAGLVLVADTMGSRSIPSFEKVKVSVPPGIDGVLHKNGVMRFGPMMMSDS
ncbi:MAG: phosphate system positive regulatory protein pho81 [Peltula sp. TS41687]|nr:MAG: phosphate system positive regulatory protein pho81 [Peltula sp. TS41687]